MVGWLSLNDSIHININPINTEMTTIFRYTVFVGNRPPGPIQYASIKGYNHQTTSKKGSPSLGIFVVVVSESTLFIWQQERYVACKINGVKLNMLYSIKWLLKWMSGVASNPVVPIHVHLPVFHKVMKVQHFSTQHIYI